MEIIANTEYQDIYRISYGVLLVVNKFEPIKYDKDIFLFGSKMKKYHKDCQSHLRILNEDYIDKNTNISIPKGTVTYLDRPVKRILDKTKYTYEVKTTGNALSGNLKQIQEYFTTMLETIKNGE